ncbi:MAG: indole-3-glycerol phosphate synthase TrpC [Rhodospirillaceae bacterium]
MTTVPDILAKICADKQIHVAERKAAVPFSELDRLARNAGPVRRFAAALKQAITIEGHALIAEIKRASPSKGLIRADFDPPVLARAYQTGGAACLSVLTDQPHFQGEDAFLPAARAACGIPVLRKDFMIDPYQIAESRALGADCVLLIMAALSDSLAAELTAAAHEYGMSVLIEVHNRREIDHAAKLPSELIGINNRNLRTMTVDLETSITLASHLPEGRIAVSESGIASPADIARLSAAGIHTFLVGESLMRHTDVATATRKLLTRHAHPVGPEH